MKDTHVQQTRDLTAAIVAAQRIVVFTGAGISTGAGIPDYRGTGGQYSRFQPVYYDEFLGSPEKQREYWLHKASVWPAMRAARPGPAHRLCTVLAARGTLNGVITQNVDGLHEKAGISGESIVNLHGSNLEVECISCGRRIPAGEVLDPMSRRYGYDDGDGGGTATGDETPSGDGGAPGGGSGAADEAFTAPRCTVCDGLLKPATIMFGQSLRTADLLRAEEILDGCDLFLAMGSTLTVQPAASLPAMAQHRGAELAIVTRGSTPQDASSNYRIDGDIDTFCLSVLEALDQ